MKLKERFIKCRNKSNEYYILPIVDDAEQLVKVAETFAIGFADWLMKTRFKSIENIPVEKLLEIYKKETL